MLAERAGRGTAEGAEAAERSTEGQEEGEEEEPQRAQRTQRGAQRGGGGSDEEGPGEELQSPPWLRGTNVEHQEEEEAGRGTAEGAEVAEKSTEGERKRGDDRASGRVVDLR
jgi:hypothetical protein